MSSTPAAPPSWQRRIVAALLALLVAAAWGTLVQTQFNLAAIGALGVAVAPGLRASTSLHDLAGFGPAYAGILVAAWLPALAVAAWLARRHPARRTALFALAAGLGLVVAIRAVDAVAPMPVLIDATRGWGGLLAMAAGSALGGGLLAHWTRRRPRPVNAASSAHPRAAAGRG